MDVIAAHLLSASAQPLRQQLVICRTLLCIYQDCICIFA